MIVRADELREDPDSYIGIAEGILAGRGFCVPGSEKPTAFRPPLYPVLITPFVGENGHWGRGLLNVFASTTVMVVLVWICRKLELSPTAQLVAILVYGLDPVLLRYVSLSMTETLSTLASVILLYCLTRKESESELPYHLTGVAFGLAVLTRPTFWAFGGLVVLWILLRKFIGSAHTRNQIRRSLLTTTGALLVVGPWVARNTIVFGKPIAMTTHGGYTVLLGNNEAFYDEVVKQPLGTIWDGSHGPGQAAWANRVNREMDDLGLMGEIERDRWMARQARETILEHPLTFLRACFLRFVRFWNVVPIGPAAAGFPRALLFAVGMLQSLIWCSVLIGIYRVFFFRQFPFDQWIPILLLVVAFTCVHLIYWSNARMRAPIVPALALLSAASVHRFREDNFLPVDE